MDGIPVHDLIGGGDDSTIKRSAYIMYAEPGLSFSAGRERFSLSVPSRLKVNRQEEESLRGNRRTHRMAAASRSIWCSWDSRTVYDTTDAVLLGWSAAGAGRFGGQRALLKLGARAPEIDLPVVSGGRVQTVCTSGPPRRGHVLADVVSVLPQRISQNPFKANAAYGAAG